MFKSNPINIRFLKDLINDSFNIFFQNEFIIFKSINNILYLIYSNQDFSIISYDIINNKKVNEVKNAHNKMITCFRYYLDKINKRDLILSSSSKYNNIKIWNAYNLECIINIEEINDGGWLYSTCFLNDNNQIYIITSNANYINNELIKVFDLNGNKIKEIKDTNDLTFFIDTYYNHKLSNIFIITGNNHFVKSYNYNTNKLYHKYCEIEKNGEHYSIIINNKEELIETSTDGNVRIWNFHTGELLNKIKVCEEGLFGICLWNNEYLFVACNIKEIKLINLNNGKIVKDLISHDDYVIIVMKINHPQYGECLISQDGEGVIKLWINKN